MSLQPNENLNGDHNQNDLQNPNPTFDNQSTAHTVDSSAILVSIRLVTKDPQLLPQDPSILSTTNTNKTQPQKRPTTSRNYDPPPTT